MSFFKFIIPTFFPIIRGIRASISCFYAILPLAVIIGSVCAFFLWSLEKVTLYRFNHPWLLFLLPLAGLIMGLCYHYFGKSAEAGNNLILEQIHKPGGGVPRRLAPLVLFATLTTHLFGGSVGCEGTAVQVGGSIASGWGKFLKLHQEEMRILLMVGIAAGFGAVFGTPWAGAIFAIEVLTRKQMRLEALFPSLLAAFTADQTCRAWGIRHTLYHLPNLPHGSLAFYWDHTLLFQIMILGIAAGVVSRLFVITEHAIHILSQKIKCIPLRPFIGGFFIILLVFIAGTRSYLGLGEWSPNPNNVTLANFFHTETIYPTAWIWKLVFTAVTLGFGFKGGEVTPLFFIGAALGNIFSSFFGVPSDLFAALGFVAIFAGASNTPLACTIMGVELFGLSHVSEIAVACLFSYLSSARSGIYGAPRDRGI